MAAKRPERTIDPMIVELHLATGGTHTATARVEIDAAVAVDTADPRWANWLVDTLRAQATEGAHHLVAALGHTPQPERAPNFVPLATVLRRIPAPVVSR